MEEIYMSGLNDRTIESIKKSPDILRYQESHCHRNSLELYNGDIMDNLNGQIGYTIINRSIVEGFAIIENIVFPHIWNCFTIRKNDDIQKEYIDITKALFFNDKSARYFETEQYNSDVLERNNANGCVFSDDTKIIAEQYAFDNNLEYRES